MNIRLLLFFIMAPLFFALAACSGTQTFTTAARAGDTVTLAVGWQKNLLRQNLTVTVTASNGSKTVYGPNDVHVRAIINLYPDPASRAVVGTMTNQDLGTGANTTGSNINQFITTDATGEHDNDWWQTSVLLDLPSPMPTGVATITMADSAGASIKSTSVMIVSGTGASNPFSIYYPPNGNPINLSPNAMLSMERAERYTVTFANATTDSNGYMIIPHSIQIQFSHTPNVGKTWIVNPRGDIKDVMWRDDGTTITVMLMSTRGKTPAQMLDYKFYVSGGVTALAQTSLKAYDVNGVAMTGITAAIQ